VVLLDSDIRHLQEIGDVKDFIEFRELAEDDARKKDMSISIDGKMHKGTICLRKKPDGSCIFLQDDGLCAIYEYRPSVCRMFPSSLCILEGEKEGKKLKKLILRIEMCEGVGEGGTMKMDETMRMLTSNIEELKNWRNLIEKWNKRKRKSFADFLKFIK
jgi:Fe-S-cluster containining protein